MRQPCSNPPASDLPTEIQFPSTGCTRSMSGRLSTTPPPPKRFVSHKPRVSRSYQSGFSALRNLWLLVKNSLCRIPAMGRGSMFRMCALFVEDIFGGVLMRFVCRAPLCPRVILPQIRRKNKFSDEKTEVMPTDRRAAVLRVKR